MTIRKKLYLMLFFFLFVIVAMTAVTYIRSRAAWCAQEMERLQAEGKREAVLGYMPDCDGDRGNIVYWNEKQKKALLLKAQEVFALSVLAELAYADKLYAAKDGYKPAVAVNCCTSMRVDDIAKAFGAKVFHGEVGEANVVNTARSAREKGFTMDDRSEERREGKECRSRWSPYH